MIQTAERVLHQRVPEATGCCPDCSVDLDEVPPLNRYSGWPICSLCDCDIRVVREEQRLKGRVA